jgi:hypothetical protein
MTPSLPTRVWFRPFAPLVVLLLAACGSEQPAPQGNFPPLDFSYLPTLALNVATLEVQSQYVPSGPPEVSQDDPAPPVAALRTMATERLKPVGTAGRAVFAIDDAAMVRSGDTITGAFSVTLNIYTSAGVRAGFAQATVTRQITNVGGDLQTALYTLTRQLMQQMNVEFEYQVRHSLHDWLVTTGPTPPPVSQQAPMPAPPPPVAEPMQQAPPSYPPPPSGPQPMAAPPPPLPYALPPAGPLPEPTTGQPPPMPSLPSTLPPAGTLPPPTTTPPPPSPPLPQPLPPLGPVQD